MGIFFVTDINIDSKFWTLTAPGGHSIAPANIIVFLFSAQNISEPGAKDFVALSCIAFEQCWLKKV